MYSDGTKYKIPRFHLIIMFVYWNLPDLTIVA